MSAESPAIMSASPESASWTLLLVPVILCLLMLIFTSFAGWSETQQTDGETSVSNACRSVADAQPRFCR